MITQINGNFYKLMKQNELETLMDWQHGDW